MSEQTVHTLVPSTSRGCYALDDHLHGQDITSGDVLLILLSGHWTQGSVEHASGLYATFACCATSLQWLLLPGQRWQRVRPLRRHESPKSVTGGN